MLRRLSTILVLLLLCGATMCANEISALRGLLNRIDPGAAEKIVVEIRPDLVDFFEITSRDGCPCVTGNRGVSVAAGINHYLKYVARVHVSWNSPTAKLPDVLPLPKEDIRLSTTLTHRYYLNYCTHSYSMAFWDWERWQREIDWMALHGIDMPLAITGTDAVWAAVLARLGYTEEEASQFIAGPAFQAWWLMNNLEGWGGPNPPERYEQQADLQQRILARMDSLGMTPVLAGYSGMLPHDAASRLGVDVADPGTWLGYTRPAFLSPTDEAFDRIADIYYEELHRLYCPAHYYSMDPFHEGGNIEGTDLGAAGEAILCAMKRHAPDATWVIQGWQENPRAELIKHLPASDVMILDLFAETSPQWSDADAAERYGDHPWLFCMLLNFGGNVGLHGKMTYLPDALESAASGALSKTLSGTGLTMEGIENNPAVFELFSELPWLAEKPDMDEWVERYATARYGAPDSDAAAAWRTLLHSVYASPAENRQQGTHESPFCARPSDNPRTASSWANSEDYYRGDSVVVAARRLLKAADVLGANPNYRYDLVDVCRQAVAEKGRRTAKALQEALTRHDAGAYKAEAEHFLKLIEMQDRLLSTIPQMRVGSWLESARRAAPTEESADLYEYNGRVQITTWGLRAASDAGGLHDYSHREWSGLLSDLYHKRWSEWFKYRIATLEGNEAVSPDFYEIESAWVNHAESYGSYSSAPEGNPIEEARNILSILD